MKGKFLENLLTFLFGFGIIEIYYLVTNGFFNLPIFLPRAGTNYGNLKYILQDSLIDNSPFAVIVGLLLVLIASLLRKNARK